MMPPPCQQIIDEIRRLKNADPSTLSEEERQNREALLLKEREWEQRSSKWSLPVNVPRKFKTMYFDTLGNEITFVEWTCATGENRIYKDIINGFLISTIWLGLNHWSGGDILHIFETMVFEQVTHDDQFDGYQERYSTLEEAKQGHERACEMVRAFNK